MASFFSEQPKKPSWGTSSLSHMQDRMIVWGWMDKTPQLHLHLRQTYLSVWAARADCLNFSWFWLSLTSYWGCACFLKCCELVNEPWICAQRHGSRLTEQVAGQQEALSLNLLYRKSALDIPWQRSLICTHARPEMWGEKHSSIKRDFQQHEGTLYTLWRKSTCLQNMVAVTVFNSAKKTKLIDRKVWYTKHPQKRNEKKHKTKSNQTKRSTRTSSIFICAIAGSHFYAASPLVRRSWIRRNNTICNQRQSFAKNK